MNKLILGTKENFYNQKNDGSFELLKKYKAESKAINCFWNACAMALEITGWINPKYPLWKKIQWTDYAIMVQYNTKHISIFENVDIRNDTEPWHGCRVRPLNEWPEYGKETINQILFNYPVAFYSTNQNAIQFDIIKGHIKNGNPVVTSSHLYGGHFICFHGFNDEKLVYSDSYKDGGWYNEFSRDEFEKTVKKYMKLWFVKKGLNYERAEI